MCSYIIDDMHKHTLLIITVIYKNYSILTDLFTSLSSQKELFHMVIVDLSPKPEPIAPPSFPITILTSSNLGYAHGVNIGLQFGLSHNYTYYCVINSDTFVQKDFVRQVVHSIELHPKSIIGGKIYYAPGYEYHTQRYTEKDKGKVLWYAGGTFDWSHALTPHRGVDEVDTGQFDLPELTGFINGCLMCFDKTVINTVGLWSEAYFMYFEDADFCARAKQKNVSLWYNPLIVMWHKNAQSTGGSGSSSHVEFQKKSRLRFGLKYAPLRTKIHLLKLLFT